MSRQMQLHEMAAKVWEQKKASQSKTVRMDFGTHFASSEDDRFVVVVPNNIPDRNQGFNPPYALVFPRTEEMAQVAEAAKILLMGGGPGTLRQNQGSILSAVVHEDAEAIRLGPVQFHCREHKNWPLPDGLREHFLEARPLLVRHLIRLARARNKKVFVPYHTLQTAWGIGYSMKVREGIGLPRDIKDACIAEGAKKIRRKKKKMFEIIP